MEERTMDHDVRAVLQAEAPATRHPNDFTDRRAMMLAQQARQAWGYAFMDAMARAREVLGDV